MNPNATKNPYPKEAKNANGKISFAVPNHSSNVGRGGTRTGKNTSRDSDKMTQNMAAKLSLPHRSLSATANLHIGNLAHVRTREGHFGNLYTTMARKSRRKGITFLNAGGGNARPTYASPSRAVCFAISTAKG